MHAYVDAAKQLSAEIERTRQRLHDLEAALEAMRPLITLEAAVPSAPALAWRESADVLHVEEVVSDAQPLTPRAPKATPEPKLPAISQDVWLRILGRRKLTVKEIVDAAMAQLGAQDEHRAVLSTRVNAWLYPALKSGKVVPAGVKDGRKAYAVAR